MNLKLLLIYWTHQLSDRQMLRTAHFKCIYFPSKSIHLQQCMFYGSEAITQPAVPLCGWTGPGVWSIITPRFSTLPTAARNLVLSTWLRPNPHWTRAHKFARNSFDVAYIQCGHFHSQQQVLFACVCYTECSLWGFLAQTIIFSGYLLMSGQ